eukprot:4111981-Prymnesium_polylepis.1
MPGAPSGKLAESEVAQCVRKIRPLWDPCKRTTDRGTCLALLVYTTRVPSWNSASPWYLGYSAAAHRVPLVVAGLGRPGWAWDEGGSQVITGSRRAAQVLAALAPAAAVVTADSGDTILANPPLAQHVGLEQTEVLVGAECMSWPKCYHALYSRDAEHQACWEKSSACFPNGGMMLARTSAALLSAFGELARMLSSYKSGQSRIGRSESTNNQAIMHRLIVNRSWLPFKVALDSRSRVFLSLLPCRANYSKRFGGPFTRCTRRAHDPAEHLHEAPTAAGEPPRI